MVSSLKHKVILIFLHHARICTSLLHFYITLMFVSLMERKLNFFKKMRYTPLSSTELDCKFTCINFSTDPYSHKKVQPPFFSGLLI